MLDTRMEAALNEQVAKEGMASFTYLAMASWCDNAGLEGCAKFMHRQSEEEREHMMKVFNYISEMDGFAKVPAFPQPQLEYTNIQSLFESVYEHEKSVTASINELVHLAMEVKDNSTFNFLQWYVEEQREEEALMRSILDRIKLIGEGPMSLYYIDKEIEKINEKELAAEGAEE